MSWRVVGASATGTGHRAEGDPCQDAFVRKRVALPSGEEALVVAVSDGAGSALCAKEAAEFVCSELVKCIASDLAAGFPPASRAREWVGEVHRRLLALAQAEQMMARDYSCTLVAAVLGPERSMFLQVGDGGMVLQSAGALGVVFWPQQGEYANSTYFVVSEDVLERLHVCECPSIFDAFAAFTDGVQFISLSYAGRVPHEPFFAPLFARVNSALDEAALTEPLAQFLDSAAVNQLTDDDKTLVLACRV